MKDGDKRSARVSGRLGKCGPLGLEKVLSLGVNPGVSERVRGGGRAMLDMEAFARVAIRSKCRQPLLDWRNGVVVSLEGFQGLGGGSTLELLELQGGG